MFARLNTIFLFVNAFNSMLQHQIRKSHIYNHITTVTASSRRILLKETGR